MDWSITASFLIGLFVGWLVEYIIDAYFWRDGKNEDVEALRLRLRNTESELANSKTQIRNLQANLVRAEERSARLSSASTAESTPA